jgi:hypothetical protein
VAAFDGFYKDAEIVMLFDIDSKSSFEYSSVLSMADFLLLLPAFALETNPLPTFYGLKAVETNPLLDMLMDSNSSL